jgi:hypothetical protein
MYYRNEDGKVIEGYNSNVFSYKNGKMPLWLIILIIVVIILIFLFICYLFSK